VLFYVLRGRLSSEWRKVRPNGPRIRPHGPGVPTGIMGYMADSSPELNVLGGALEPCGTDPMTGFYRDGSCSCGDEDIGLHAVCAVVTEEFLDHQRSVGNDLMTPVPEFAFPGLKAGDRWCVVAVRWLEAYREGVAAPVVLASTNARALEVIPLSVLKEHAVDVPPDVSGLTGG
jgi:uncharacterized protein (DUF2237 family)